MSQKTIKQKKTPRYKNDDTKLNERQLKLLKFGIIICIIIVIYGALNIINAIQLVIRNSKASEQAEIQMDNSPIPAYNVDGLTDEEIDELLERTRQQREESAN